MSIQEGDIIKIILDVVPASNDSVRIVVRGAYPIDSPSPPPLDGYLARNEVHTFFGRTTDIRALRI